MERGNFRRICTITLFSMIVLLSLTVNGQSVLSPKVETPNVASLNNFATIPVDLSTGVPNISIPIHTLQFGNISVPIALRYHPGALRITQHPGWVGFCWDLQAGGAITRQVREYPDEYYGSLIPSDLGSTYYPEPVGTPPISGSEIIDNATNWDSQSQLSSYFQPNSSGTISDVSADEFSFNFLGYSGKFYFISPSKGWQAVCDQNVRVTLINPSNPCIDGYHVISTIVGQYSASQTQATGHLFANGTDESATRVFSGFIITVPDGTKYYFGGSDANSNGIGIEFSTSYGSGATQFNADTWLLTKIVDVDNNEVDFNYSASYPTVDLGFQYNAQSSDCEVIDTDKKLDRDHFSGSLSGPINVNYHGGTLKLPLYLDNITCNNETITFNRGQSNSCLRFSDDAFRYINLTGQNVPENKFVLSILGDGLPDGNNGLINGCNNIQWEQLNSMVIKNSNNQVYRQYLFNYSNSSSQRLALMSFQELDNSGSSPNTATSIAKYSFLYNDINNINTIPELPIYDGNSTDHWGFYNGPASVGLANTTITDASPGSIYYYRQTNPSYVTKGALSQINYPTGGNTVFLWEAHNYSQVVSNFRTAPLLSQTGSAGGVRIREVISTLPNGTVALDKKFLYVRSYTNANPNPLGLASSGILNGTPTYYMQLLNRTGVNSQITESITVKSLNSLSVYSYNSQSSYIGYDEVVEKNGDGSYTKNFFTNYGPDLNNVSHWDINPTGHLGWLLGTDNYYPMNTLDNERGKPIASFEYTKNDVLVQKTLNTYRNDPSRFNNYIKLISFNGAYSGCARFDALILAAANRIFTYDYYLINQSITKYDQLGENPFTTSMSYTYNVNNLLSSKAESNSKGEIIQTTYSYPNEITSSDPGYGTYQAMTNAHILTPVIQTVVTNNGTQVNLTKTNYYSPSSGLYKPQTVQVQVGSNAPETRQQFYNYDTHGNLQEMSKTNDIHEVYLWGYNNQYPVAKITGSTLTAVSATVTQLQAQIDAATSALNNDANIRTLLKNVRTGLPNAFVTYYTYLPITGVTSETDPRGQSTFYQYDNFQRLKSITDFNTNILKTFNYQYQISQ